jgi:hypothetical protein
MKYQAVNVVQRENDRVKGRRQMSIAQGIEKLATIKSDLAPVARSL